MNLVLPRTKICIMYNYCSVFRISTFTFLLLIILPSSGCVVEDDDPIDGMDPIEEISFQVEVKKIRSTEIKEAEGDALEIYGLVTASLEVGTTTDERALLSIDEDNYISVELNDRQLDGSVTFTINEEDVAESVLTTEADLSELDFNNPHDPLGVVSSTVNLNEIFDTEEFQLTYPVAGGQGVSLSYSVTRL